jgi:hypothetical protein
MKNAKLTRIQLEALAQATARTAHDELSCDALLDRLAAYAEAGQSLPPDDRRLIEQHLAICPECTEELRALLDALTS